MVDPPSGNPGVGLAAIGACRGYRVVLTMPASMSQERCMLLAALGAELVLTPAEAGMQGAIDKADELVKAIPGAVLAGQFVNPANVKAHYETTGPELWQQTDGRIDCFVAGVGTGGTITGTGRYLKEQNPQVHILAVEPSDSPVLSGGQLVEVTRADLVGRYVGHTAPLTTQVLKSAVGGVLFIDEAYSLYRGKDDSFGLEAIDTLVKGMEDHRDDLIVILAGYSKEMAEFLTANSGLKSRFPNIIEFPDYTGEELLAIAKLQAGGKGYTLDERCDANLLAYFNAVQLTRARDAGNGRLARNKVEEAILNQSRRLVAQPEADLCLLLPEDFQLDDVGGV